MSGSSHPREVVQLVRHECGKDGTTFTVPRGPFGFAPKELGVLMAVLVVEKPQLLKFFMACDRIGSESATKIAEALPGLRQLQELRLENNRIGDEGATKIAEALPSLGQLRSLHLGFNCFGDEGATKIAEALPSLGQLRSLHLGCNCFADEGATKIAEALPSLGQLQELYLDGTDIGDKGTAKIAEALPSLGQLQELRLDVSPYDVAWSAMGWAMPAEVLAAAKHHSNSEQCFQQSMNWCAVRDDCDYVEEIDFWDWGGMAGVMAAKARESTGWLPPHVRARLDALQTNPRARNAAAARKAQARAEAEAEAEKLIQDATQARADAERDAALIVAQAEQAASQLLRLTEQARAGTERNAARILREARAEAETVMQAARQARAEAEYIVTAAEWDARGMVQTARQASTEGERDAARIVTHARAEVDAMVEQARQERDAARAERAEVERDAAQIVREARTEAERDASQTLREARAEAEAIVGSARKEAGQVAREAGRGMERVEGGAVAAVGGRGGREARGREARSSLSVFFHGELAEATQHFAGERRLGGGGFGGVFRASGVGGFGDGAELAVKRLDAGSVQGQAEFLQEVQVLGGCRHENLLPLLGFSADGGEDGRVCLVFPLMQGGSLQDRLFSEPRGEPLGWSDRLRICVSVAQALDYLHTPDPGAYKPAMLHKDIKPANILLDADGLVRLADVGIARMQRDDQTHISLTAVAGTNGFIDPNYMQTGHYDAASDAYSLGITVLILLTGWPAIEAGNTVFDRCEAEDAMHVADRMAGWPAEKAAEVHRVGLGLAEPRKRTRMPVSEALAALTRLVDAQPSGSVAPADVVERECLVCMAAPKTTRLGCGHAVYCRPCLQLALSRPSSTCPYCRRPVTREAAVESDAIAQQNTFVMPLQR